MKAAKNGRGSQVPPRKSVGRVLVKSLPRTIGCRLIEVNLQEANSRVAFY